MPKEPEAEAALVRYLRDNPTQADRLDAVANKVGDLDTGYEDVLYRLTRGRARLTDDAIGKAIDKTYARFMK